MRFSFSDLLSLKLIVMVMCSLTIVLVALSNYDYSRLFRTQPKGPEQCWRGMCPTGLVCNHQGCYVNNSLAFL